MQGQVEIPAHASVVAVGTVAVHHVITGYYIDPKDKANEVVRVLEEPASAPVRIQLAAQFCENGTTGLVASNAVSATRISGGTADIG